MATATAPPAVMERLPRSRSTVPLSWDRVMPILMIAPSVILIAIFVYGFIGRTAFTSLTAWRGVVPDYTFVGLRNYERLFQTEKFQADIVNTVHFTAFFLAGCLILGLGAAVLLDQKLRGSIIFQNVFVFPLLRPITLSAVIILGHISLKIFDLVFVMTFGGPGYSTDMPGLNMFITTFRQDLFARGAAIATVLLLMVALLIVPYLIWNLRGETER